MIQSGDTLKSNDYSDNKNNSDNSESVQAILILVAVALLSIWLFKQKNIFSTAEATPNNNFSVQQSQFINVNEHATETLLSKQQETKEYQSIASTDEAFVFALATSYAGYLAADEKQYLNSGKNISTPTAILYSINYDSSSYDPSKPATYDNPRPIYPTCPLGCKKHQLGCNVKGNISFDTKEKIYHLPGQTFYNETVINPEYGELWFCTEEEAIKNGWRKSDN